MIWVSKKCTKKKKKKKTLFQIISLASCVFKKNRLKGKNRGHEILVLPFTVVFGLSPVNFPPLTSKALIQLCLLELGPFLRKTSPEGDWLPVPAWLAGLI